MEVMLAFLFGAACGLAIMYAICDVRWAQSERRVITHARRW